MISRGARDLVFLSRSGADKPEAASLIAELEEMKLVEYPNLTWQIIRGDVSDASAVDAAIESACHPIKGVVQAAMVLRVRNRKNNDDDVKWCANSRYRKASSTP